jgi:hypothetical protein
LSISKEIKFHVSRKKTFGLRAILRLLKRQNGPWTQDQRREAECLKREDRAYNNVISSRKLKISDHLARMT